MEIFKYLLFGVTGLSLIFWVSVIALWHTYMFPRIFKEDYAQGAPIADTLPLSNEISKSGLFNRNIYTNKSFVIANFNPAPSDYHVNRLFTFILFSLGIMSFIIISYGLSSGFKLYGIT
tara:strand:- start:194 stop:550 length:357 start_codon:yes stop_codon:yes gene_type:complete